MERVELRHPRAQCTRCNHPLWMHWKSVPRTKESVSADTGCVIHCRCPFFRPKEIWDEYYSFKVDEVTKRLTGQKLLTVEDFSYSYQAKARLNFKPGFNFESWYST